jgi:hypothetical protein
MKPPNITGCEKKRIELMNITEGETKKYVKLSFSSNDSTPF